MKLFNKYVYTAALAGLISLSFTSCSDKDDYSPGSPASGDQVYFPAGMQSQYSLSEDGTSFTITIYRIDDSNDVTVPITVSPSETNTLTSAFTFPASVTFAKGSKTAEYTVLYDIEQFQYEEDGEVNWYYEETQQFNLEIDDASITPYGVAEIIISATLPGPWTSLGIGTYTDAYWGCNDSDDDDEVITSNVEFYVSDLDPNLFRVNNPYTWLAEDENEYFQFRLLPPGSSYEESWGETYEIPADFSQTLVYFPSFRIDFYAYYGADLYIHFPWRFSSSENPDLYQTPDYWKYNYVVDWQAPKTVNGTSMTLPGEIHLSPVYYMNGVGGWFRWEDQDITIVFPGYKKLDTSISVTYNGLLHKEDGTLEAEAYVTLGKNVSSAQVALIDGNSVSSDILAEIQDGTIESVTITSSSQVNLPFDVDNSEGRYSIVALSYYEGEMRNYDYYSFKYTPATSESWNYVTTGLYTYLEDMWSEDGEDVTDVLDLYESASTPGKFKLDNWMGADYPLVFYVDSNGEITVPEQETGVVEGDYGMIYISDMNTYTGTNNWESVLEDGVYYFAIIYYVEAGYFGYGYEYFEPMTAQQSAAKVGTRTVSNADKFLRIQSKLKSDSIYKTHKRQMWEKSLETGIMVNR